MANLELSMNALAVLNLMPRLIKIRLSSYLVLFRKVLRDTSRSVFGRQECVAGKKYTPILFYLFLVCPLRDRVKDLTGSSYVSYVT